MKVTQIVKKLDRFGETEAKKIDDCGNIVFHTECNLDSVSEVEGLVEYVDRLPTANLMITGNSRNALIIVKVSCEEFNQIPPYLQQDWIKDSDDII
jgi:hypothetical protein